MMKELWDVLGRFTPDAQEKAIEKFAELEIEQAEGEVTLNESYNNLLWCCNTLRDAIEKQKLIQLPITIQREILEISKGISANHDALIEGEDVVAELSASIEELFTAVWRYGLNHLSDEVLGYQTKLNQLKDIERSVIQTKLALEDGIRTRSELEKLLAEVKGHSEEIESKLSTAETAAETSAKLVGLIEENGVQATETLGEIISHSKSALADLATVQASKTEVQSDEEKIRSMVDEFSKLTDELAANKKTQKELFDEFEGFRKKIDGLLADSNRTGLAASFTNRRLWLIAPLVGWLTVFGFSIYGLWYIGDQHIVPILNENKSVLWELLPLRLALTAPLIWLGWFSARQYGFTSRLREDYAYKEASSKSFEGFKREAKELDEEMLKKLLDQAIKNLGDNPIRIFDGKNNHTSPTQEFVEALLSNESFKKLLGSKVPKAAE
jgi:hypothetical protein